MPDLLLVNPSAKADNYGPLKAFFAIEPPLWCALIAAYVREQGFSVAILDAEAEGLNVQATANKIVEINPKLTAIIVMGINPTVSSTPKMTATNKLVRSIKDKDSRSKVVLGGLHPSALPSRTLQESGADYVCQGEGFSEITGLLQSVLKNSPHPGPKILQSRAVDLSSLHWAAWDLLPMSKYRAHNWQCLDDLSKRSRYAMVYTSLGCPFRCTCCNVHAMHGGKPGIRYRDPKDVVLEIEYLTSTYGVRTFKFMDELFALNKSHVKQVCEGIEKLGRDLNIWAYARVDTVDREMITVMARASIKWLAFGFESANERVLQGVSKKLNLVQMTEAVSMCKSAGVNIIANFMFGLPDDDMETMQQTLVLAEQSNFEWVNFYCTAAYPGSKLFEDAVRQGIRLPTEWADYSQFSPRFIPLPTKYLKAEEVLKFRDNAFKEYFSRQGYLSMIESKFGMKAREHIGEMLKIEIKREHV